MESIAARAALNLDPALRLTPDGIEAAYRAALWARHPWRYPDGESRRSAEQWATTLGEARATLLAESAADRAAHATTPASRRGLSTGWIVGIVAGGTAIVVGLIVALAFGVSALSERVTELAEPPFEGGSDSETVEHYSAAETMFGFPAALEYYFDERYLDQCSLEFEQGCWTAGVIPESDCEIMIVSISFASTEEQATSDFDQTLRFFDVVAGETTPVVYGNDEYASSWIQDVTCNEGSV
ncbi:hypothetical protein ASE14_19190 [Agromyces sp. Root81]|uniref:hypothetical protein n=1 Tax=Agromyces sp. Root81 TaxID=1736601 RepID=UPI0006F913FC|nr:hypothetical protein [Agromyces sp. Root81]KRC58667.1 hypothetical protein ASE14_19190 [Agromyces sp. Root81]